MTTIEIWRKLEELDSEVCMRMADDGSWFVDSKIMKADSKGYVEVFDSYNFEFVKAILKMWFRVSNAFRVWNGEKHYTWDWTSDKWMEVE